jgi:hypothetical protein
MPNRFRPGVLPDYEPRSNPGDDVAAAIEAFQGLKDQQADRAYVQEERDYQRTQREAAAPAQQMANVQAGLEFGRYLEDEGLRPVMPRDIEEMQRNPRQAQLPQGGAFDGARIGMADQQQSTPGSLFDGAMAAGPRGATKPSVLPGQFSRQLGAFAPQALYFDAITQNQPRITIAGQEFTQGARRVDREEQLAQEVRREEIERLIAAGVPADRAEFVRDDPALKRSYLGPADPADLEPGPYSQERLEFEEKLEAIRARYRPYGDGGTGTGAGRDRLDMNQAMNQLKDLYAVRQYGRETGTYRISEAQMYDLATAMANGERVTFPTFEEDAPAAEEPVNTDVGPVRRRLIGWLGGDVPAAATPPAALDPAQRVAVDSALAEIKSLPHVAAMTDDELREDLEAVGYTPDLIELILQARGRP